ncbi:MAG: DinB family protein, partial [Chloroflexota bacterium]
MLTTEERQRRIAIIREFPVRLTELVTPLSEAQLTARPLANEWTVKQIVHHLPDSHMNSVTRLKLILTSDHPL